VLFLGRRPCIATAQGIALGRKQGLFVLFLGRRPCIATAQGIALGKIRKEMQPERLQEVNNSKTAISAELHLVQNEMVILHSFVDF
jgi:hypothetical protein